MNFMGIINLIKNFYFIKPKFFKMNWTLLLTFQESNIFLIKFRLIEIML